MRKIRILTICTLLFIAVLHAGAISAYPGIKKVRQPDGTILSYRLTGDEHRHSLATTDGYLIRPDAEGVMRYITVDNNGMQRFSETMAHNSEGRSPKEIEFVKRAGIKSLQKLFPITARTPAHVNRMPGVPFPTIGDLRGIILLVEFADNAMQPGNDSKKFYSLMNDKGTTIEGATGSARDFYMDQSMNKFTPTFDVVGPIKLSHEMAYYGANNEMGEDVRPQLMVKEACEYADKQLGVDFSKYDFNNDGNVDFVYVIYAGYAESYGADANTIWPHNYDLAQAGVGCVVDGKQVRNYACSSELKYTEGTQIDGIGTFCHEFGHVLGLPDMYDVDNQQNIQLGYWDTMDLGCYNNDSHTPAAFSAFERSSLGWLELKEINTPADSLTLKELTENNVAYRINTANEDEYFTLENRQQKGWDKYQPGRGLMIIHVNYDQMYWQANAVNAGGLQFYDLMEADGTQGTSQQTDLYPIPGNDMFTDYSSPASITFQGYGVEKSVTHIRDNNGVISFDFMKDRLQRPILTETTDIGTRSFTAHWEPVVDAGFYKLNVEENLPDSVNPLVGDEGFGKMETGKYPDADEQDISVFINHFMTAPGWWYGSGLYSCGGYVRIGNKGVSGSLESPYLDLTPFEGTCSILLDGVSYPDTTVTFTVSLTDMNTRKVIDSDTLKADSNKKTFYTVLKGGNDNCMVSVKTDNERLFVDRLTLTKGAIDSAQVRTVGPLKWEIENIPDTFCVVEDLVPGRTYNYTVQAMNEDSAKTSYLSAVGEVTTKTTTGIQNVVAKTNSPVVSVNYYDLSGRMMAAPMSGICIRKLRYADGTIRTDKIVVNR